ncbi:DUF4397 domain-containing protein [Pedobacter sp. Leaf194]|uniref:DUF4397 domain-containing protein n=1 Tax=Pedobacter sp. Leaf194 TaxID=1736297 RepID=UPI0007037339|nr:DUF4397 domain-containing protein [Pedobacter sp. Leaf194]KQS37067.1 hypothetical protein ASG14_08560 [Pedobacter sp. Leaf194]
MKTTLKNFKTTAKTIFALLAVTLFLSACKKDWGDSNSITVAGIGFVHASPGTGALDFIVDNQRANNREFKYTNDLGYFGAYPGTRLFGIAKKDSVKYLSTTNVNLQSGFFYSAFVIDVLPSPKILVIQDDLTAPATGKAKIRFINLSPDAPALDLAVEGNATALVTGKAYKETSPFISIDPAAAYTFQIKESNNVTATLPATKIEAGKIYTLWAKGLKSKTDSTKFGLSILTNK